MLIFALLKQFCSKNVPSVWWDLNLYLQSFQVVGKPFDRLLDHHSDGPIFWPTCVSEKNDIVWAVVVVKWSACSPSTLTIQVWILLSSTVFLWKLYLKRTKINKKRPGLGHLKKIMFGKFPKLRNTNSNSCFYYLAIQSWSVWLRNTYAWWIWHISNNNNSRSKPFLVIH